MDEYLSSILHTGEAMQLFCTCLHRAILFMNLISTTYTSVFNSIQFNFIQNPFDPDTGCNVQAIGYRLSHVSNVCSNY
jgi:hypothetical protein